MDEGNLNTASPGAATPASSRYGGGTAQRPTRGSPFYTPEGLASTNNDGVPLLENSFDAAAAGSAASDPTMLMFGGTDESVRQAHSPQEQQAVREEESPPQQPHPPGVLDDKFDPENHTGASPGLRQAAADAAPPPEASPPQPQQVVSAGAAPAAAAKEEAAGTGAPAEAARDHERLEEGWREQDAEDENGMTTRTSNKASETNESCCGWLTWKYLEDNLTMDNLKDFARDFFDGDQYFPAESNTCVVCVPYQSTKTGRKKMQFRRYRLTLRSQNPQKLADWKRDIKKEIYKKDEDDDGFISREEAVNCRRRLWTWCKAHEKDIVSICRVYANGEKMHDVKKEDIDMKNDKWKEWEKAHSPDDAECEDTDSEYESTEEAYEDDPDDGKKEDKYFLHVLEDQLFADSGPLTGKEFQRQPSYFMLGWTAIIATFWLAGSLTEAIGEETDEAWPAVYGGLETYIPGETALQTHDQCTKQHTQIWRWWTYQFTHTGARHIGFNAMLNIALGVSMEKWQGPAWMAFFFQIGVIGGACWTVVFDCHTSVVGCSGGCYSLVGLQVSDLVMNFSMRFRRPVLFFVKLFVICVLPIADLASGPDVSHTAHWGGMLTGLLVGVCFGYNEKVTDWEKPLIIAAMVTLVLMFLSTLLWTTTQWPPRSLFSDELWCFKQQVSNYVYFRDSDWHCVRGYSDEFVREWSSPNQAHALDVSVAACDDLGWDVIE